MQSHEKDHGRTPIPSGANHYLEGAAQNRPKAKVILFKPSGKYYTEEEWEIPTREEVVERGGLPGDSVGPFCMKYSKDFRRINGGSVLIETQEPWGYPHLLLGV